MFLSAYKSSLIRWSRQCKQINGLKIIAMTNNYSLESNNIGEDKTNKELKVDDTTRIANLGKITDYLIKDGVPNLLVENYNDKYISDSVKLRLFPSLGYIPIISGRTKFNGSMNALRLILSTFILGHDIKHLHIHSIKNSTSEDSPNTHAYYKNSQKIIVKWSTCSPEEKCHHIKDRNTGIQAHHRIRDENNSTKEYNHKHVLDYILQPSNDKLNSANIEKEYKNILFKKHNSEGEPISRVLQGLFIFELSDDNSEIEVHTIEDIELIDYKKKMKEHTPHFAIC
ncbi:similar to Saccharomyces cerevisiae YGR053C Putative protein of unknown function [Maudiozyma saulgeensis]|uniref:Uncharacterized protein n=1 Tax=Maudiozyma saulgeensis TaxID=1789683 RepID=A0A1X7QZ15_9SACH|nr:similar to Saccharomyces cerevisiae YGR053C Putative protein of unknown function [Kazachstania saulgeensis]